MTKVPAERAAPGGGGRWLAVHQAYLHPPVLPAGPDALLGGLDGVAHLPDARSPTRWMCTSTASEFASSRRSTSSALSSAIAPRFGVSAFPHAGRQQGAVPTLILPSRNSLRAYRRMCRPPHASWRRRTRNGDGQIRAVAEYQRRLVVGLKPVLIASSRNCCGARRLWLLRTGRHLSTVQPVSLRDEVVLGLAVA